MTRAFRLNGIAVAVLSMVASAAIHADDASAPATAPDTRFYLSIMGSLATPDTHRGSQFGYGGALALGKRLSPYFEAEVLGTYTEFRTKKSEFATPEPSGSQLDGAGLGVNYFPLGGSDGVAKGLFLHLDAQGAWGYHAPGAHRDYKAVLAEPGLGYDFILNNEAHGLIPEGIAIRTEVLYRGEDNSVHDVGVPSTEHRKFFSEGVLNIGVRIPFGAGPSPAVQVVEAPAEVVPAVAVAPEPAETAPPPAPPAPTCAPPLAGELITLEGCSAGATIILRGVNFNFNKATLTENAKGLLDGVVTALQSRPDVKVEIDGHTDGKGSAHYNLKLSEHRAVTVRKYLVDKAIASERITTKGFGKSRPIADNTTDSGRELNRRVELRVTDSAPGSAAFTIEQPGEATVTSTPAPATPDAPAADAAPVAAPAADAGSPPADGTAPPAPQ